MGATLSVRHPVAGPPEVHVLRNPGKPALGMISGSSDAETQEHQACAAAAAGSAAQGSARVLSAQGLHPPEDSWRRGPPCEVPALVRAGPAPGPWASN
ncbi:hypothetical protein QTO34_012947 [Cnephaeus nilssonii]|uniref:Uncharacterized protein n=1 Tax=Cnephaeus nilssonii TaxID=3371016 RepID=A0AA40LDM7_CNENI|nr:hypothetical protein QTO34_012947 [Eptesicus nilssonii]